MDFLSGLAGAACGIAQGLYNVYRSKPSATSTALVTVRESVADACDDLSTSIKKIRGAASWAPTEGLDFAERRILPRLPPSVRRLVRVVGRKTAPTYNITTSPWRAERLNFELRDTRAKLDLTNEQLDSLVAFINREVASAAKKEAELKKVKATTAVKAVAATMLLTLHKQALSSEEFRRASVSPKKTSPKSAGVFRPLADMTNSPSPRKRVVAVKRAEDTTRLRRELAQAEQDASELQEMVLEKDARHEADKARIAELEGRLRQALEELERPSSSACSSPGGSPSYPIMYLPSPEGTPGTAREQDGDAASPAYLGPEYSVGALRKYCNRRTKEAVNRQLLLEGPRSASASPRCRELATVSPRATTSPVSSVESLCSSESDEEKDDGTSAALVVWRDDSPAESGSKKEEEDSNSAAVAVRQDESAAEEQLSSPERLKAHMLEASGGRIAPWLLPVWKVDSSEDTAAASRGPRLPNRSFAAGKWTPGGKRF